MSEAKPLFHYPTTFGEIPARAKENGVGVREAGLRFARYAILRGIALGFHCDDEGSGPYARFSSCAVAFKEAS